MCIVFKTDKKIGLPTDDTLDSIYSSNPHGGGVAWVYTEPNGKKRISYVKGLMTVSAFKTEVKKAFECLSKDDDYLIAHTRISTSGGISPQKTHPFKTKRGFAFSKWCDSYSI